MQKFYISGIYFSHKPDTAKFLEYAKWLRSVGGKKVSKSMINYALFEVFAEYRRCGISKTDVIRAALSFGPFFVAKEVIRRKRSAAEDIKKCLKVADGLKLRQTSGTKSFPIFEK